MSERAGFVYLIGIEDQRLLGSSPLKVGIAQNLNARLSGMQTSTPLKLRRHGSWKYPNILVARRFEQAFHNAFKKQRVSGEWFEITVEEARATLDRFHEDYVMRKEPEKSSESEAFEILGAKTFANIRAAVSAVDTLSEHQRRYRKRENGGGGTHAKS